MRTEELTIHQDKRPGWVQLVSGRLVSWTYLQVSLDVEGDLQHVLRLEALHLLPEESQGQDGRLQGQTGWIRTCAVGPRGARRDRRLVLPLLWRRRCGIDRLSTGLPASPGSASPSCSHENNQITSESRPFSAAKDEIPAHPASKDAEKFSQMSTTLQFFSPGMNFPKSQINSALLSFF